MLAADLLGRAVPRRFEVAQSGRNPPAEKWDIRKHIQPQLAELWSVHPTLLGHQIANTAPVAERGLPRDTSIPSGAVPADTASGELKHRGADRARAKLQETIDVDGHSFLPLVRSALNLTCTLDILFLRKDSPGAGVTRGGDIDNRIKTLFDGLRVPHAGEIAAEGTIAPVPFHCLLEDDHLVTALTVRTDRLLTRP